MPLILPLILREGEYGSWSCSFGLSSELALCPYWLHLLAIAALQGNSFLLLDVLSLLVRMTLNVIHLRGLRTYSECSVSWTYPLKGASPRHPALTV